MIQPLTASGQSTQKTGPSQNFKRDPFLLPSGVRPSKDGSASGSIENKTAEKTPLPLKIKSILISDTIRLAVIDRDIVTVGDLIDGERVLEIEEDKVVLGKGEKKRTLFLDQSPIQLTAEEQGEKQ